jgi:hypothetical protein
MTEIATIITGLKVRNLGQSGKIILSGLSKKDISRLKRVRAQLKISIEINGSQAVLTPDIIYDNGEGIFSFRLNGGGKRTLVSKERALKILEEMVEDAKLLSDRIRECAPLP